MPLMHGLLNLIMLAITIWFYWRILAKAGISGWWAYLMLLSVALVFIDSIIRGPLFFTVIVPYIVPAVLIWYFAFMRWPSFEQDPHSERNRRFAQQGRDWRDEMPSSDQHRSVNPSFTEADQPEGRRRRKRKQ